MRNITSITLQRNDSIRVYVTYRDGSSSSWNEDSWDYAWEWATTVRREHGLKLVSAGERTHLWA